ncbi:MAG TPA: flagellar hook-basal body complex protein FliE [Pseudolabrys sp.]|jgi:flagellar hook-basal body complex protein FliE|nr:flagellar hook-basal body complex protein FliE [Pseudolabrys sp.]
MASPISAANAYASIARLTSNNPLGGGAAGGADSGTSFASVLKQAIGEVDNIGRHSDAQTRAVAAGKANMVDVVTAVSQTEVAIDAVVAVRDKIISAYEDIMKMPI